MRVKLLFMMIQVKQLKEFRTAVRLAACAPLTAMDME